MSNVIKLDVSKNAGKKRRLRGKAKPLSFVYHKAIKLIAKEIDDENTINYSNIVLYTPDQLPSGDF